MIAAKIYPEPDNKRGSGGSKSLATKDFPMVNAASLSLARMVLREAPDLYQRRFFNLSRRRCKRASNSAGGISQRRALSSQRPKPLRHHKQIVSI